MLKYSKIFSVPELNPEIYGIPKDEVLQGKDLNISDLADQLKLIYCGPMAIEFMHINVNFFYYWYS